MMNINLRQFCLGLHILLILDGNLMSNIYYLICSTHLIRSKAEAKNEERFFSNMKSSKRKVHVVHEI